MKICIFSKFGQDGFKIVLVKVIKNKSGDNHTFNRPKGFLFAFRRKLNNDKHTGS